MILGMSLFTNPSVVFLIPTSIPSDFTMVRSLGSFAWVECADGDMSTLLAERIGEEVRITRSASELYDMHTEIRMTINFANVTDSKYIYSPSPSFVYVAVA